jgi:Domain of unknown function (DUF4168)
MRLIAGLVLSGACATAHGAAIARFFFNSPHSQSSSTPCIENADDPPPRGRRDHHHRQKEPRSAWLWLGRGGSLQSSRSSSSGGGSPTASSSQSSSASSAAATNPFRRQQQQQQGDSESRMPSLFPLEETVFDRYAACLAATEGLRRIRDRDLAEEVNLRGFGASSTPSSSGGSSIYDAERQINLQYVQNSERVLRALGMSVNQFNDLGKQITQDEKLREKVRGSGRSNLGISPPRGHQMDRQEFFW